MENGNKSEATRRNVTLKSMFELLLVFSFNLQPSKITCASAWLSVCVMLSATLFTPICCAIFAASPVIANVGRPLVSRTTSKSTHFTPRRQAISTPIPTINSRLHLECGSLLALSLEGLPLFRQPPRQIWSGNDTVSRSQWICVFLFGLYLRDCGSHENT